MPSPFCWLRAILVLPVWSTRWLGSRMATWVISKSGLIKSFILASVHTWRSRGFIPPYVISFALSNKQYLGPSIILSWLARWEWIASLKPIDPDSEVGQLTEVALSTSTLSSSVQLCSSNRVVISWISSWRVAVLELWPLFLELLLKDFPFFLLAPLYGIL